MHADRFTPLMGKARTWLSAEYGFDVEVFDEAAGDSSRYSESDVLEGDEGELDLEEQPLEHDGWSAVVPRSALM